MEDRMCGECEFCSDEPEECSFLAHEFLAYICSDDDSLMQKNFPACPDFKPKQPANSEEEGK